MIRKPVEFHFDFISPYAYLAIGPAESLVRRHGRSLDWHPLLLGVTVIKVMGLKPVPETPLKGDYARRDVERLALLHGIPFRHHGLSGVTPVPALRAFVWLKQHDREAAVRFAKAVFERLWVAGQDISRPEDLAEPAAEAGVDPDEVIAGCRSDYARQALATAVDEAVAKGVFGVPFLIADDEPFWGGDRLPLLDHWLQHASWTGGPP